MEESLITKSEWQIDLQNLREATDDILAKYPIELRGQLGFTHRPGTNAGEARVYDSIGYHFNPNDKIYFGENDFPVFNDEFRSTYFYDIYQSFPFRVGRMRLMLCRPGSCYSMHRDLGVRYHVAVQTNPDCFILFASGRAFHVPADGYIYRMDATARHTALNSGKENRLHLVLQTRQPIEPPV